MGTKSTKNKRTDDSLKKQNFPSLKKQYRSNSNDKPLSSQAAKLTLCKMRWMVPLGGMSEIFQPLMETQKKNSIDDEKRVQNFVTPSD